MNPQQPRYFNFPLIMLAKLTIDPTAGFNEITAFALRGFSQSFGSLASDHREALIQACYVSTRQKDNPLPQAVKRILARQDISDFCECLGECFGGGDFQAAALETLEDYNIVLSEGEKAELTDWYTIRGAASYFGREIQSFDGIERQAAAAQRFTDEHARQFGRLAFCSIEAEYFFETRQSFSIETGRRLRMVCAVRSLIGDKVLTGSTKAMIRARMVGGKSPAIAEQLTRRNKALQDELEALQSRKRFDRLMDETASRGFFGKVGKGRRLYLSTEIKDPVDLAAKVAKTFDRKKAYQQRERQARGTIGASWGQQGGIIGDIFNKAFNKDV